MVTFLPANLVRSRGAGPCANLPDFIKLFAREIVAGMGYLGN